MEYSAMISNCNKYRYKLTRTWDEDKGKVLFIMLNPSTADEKTDDLTTRRCMNFAKNWGYGGLLIGNIYPFRAKRPKDLRKWIKQDHDSNYETGLGISYAKMSNRDSVHQMAEQADLVVCAWGCNYKGGMPEWVDELGDLFYLELCKDNITPKHPLGNLSKDAIPTNYNLNTIVVG